jgi:hypothetical protein
MIARNGDWLIAPFQCEHCHFINIYNRVDLTDSEHDKLILLYIRRANLDMFWSRTDSTVRSNLSSVKEILKMSQELDMPVPLSTLGPWPLEDVVGMRLAIIELKKSQGKDRPNAISSTHLQYATVRRLRGAVSCVSDAAYQGNCTTLTMKSLKGDVYHLHQGVTQSRFFERFSLRMKVRMGQCTRRNFPIKSNMVGAVLDRMKDMISAIGGNAEHERRRLLILAGAFIAVLFGGSMRGNEGLMLDGDQLGRHIMLGTDHELPHVLAPMYGYWKGEDGERFHIVPIISVSRTGIEFRWWLEQLLVCLDKEGNLGKGGPAFCNLDGSLIRGSRLEGVIVDVMVSIQDEQPGDSPFPKSLNIPEDFGIYRSFRRGSTTEAADQDISEFTIKLVNRWERYERSRGRLPNMGIMEHYLEISGLIRKILSFSASL